MRSGKDIITVPRRPARPTSATISDCRYKFNILPPSGVRRSDKKSKYPASATTMSIKMKTNSKRKSEMTAR